MLGSYFASPVTNQTEYTSQQRQLIYQRALVTPPLFDVKQSKIEMSAGVDQQNSSANGHLNQNNGVISGTSLLTSFIKKNKGAVELPKPEYYTQTSYYQYSTNDEANRTISTEDKEVLKSFLVCNPTGHDTFMRERFDKPNKPYLRTREANQQQGDIGLERYLNLNFPP